MQVRTLGDADLEACLDLFESVAAEGLWLATEAPLDRREVAAAWRDLLSTREGTLLVADDDGACVGLAAMVGRRSPELGMLVRADRRRQGIGDALLDACVAWARARNASEIVLYVFAHNPAAVALYRKHGFEERSAVRRAYRRASGERWDAIRMVKPLGGAPGTSPASPASP